MTAALVLWTFLFPAPAGQSVVNLTAQACHQLQADIQRIRRLPDGSDTGSCIPQSQWVNR